MANFNFKERVIECKIVYYGPGRCGKTTNLEYIFKAFKKSTSSDMISIDTKGDRTLFFDFLPMGLGKIRGCDVTIQLYTVPGQQKYSSTRKMVLKGVDGIVFVADLLRVRRQENITSLKNLHHNLIEYNKSLFSIPLVFQFNKADLVAQDIPLLPTEALAKELNSRLRKPYFVASAITGKNVALTLKKITSMTISNLRNN